MVYAVGDARGRSLGSAYFVTTSKILLPSPRRDVPRAQGRARNCVPGHGVGRSLGLKSKKLQAVHGVLRDVENMQIEIRSYNESRKKGLVTRGDDFYIEGVEPRVYSGQAGECIFRLGVPDDAGAIHDAGLVQCHPSQ